MTHRLSCPHHLAVALNGTVDYSTKGVWGTAARPENRCLLDGPKKALARGGNYPLHYSTNTVETPGCAAIAQEGQSDMRWHCGWRVRRRRRLRTVWILRGRPSLTG